MPLMHSEVLDDHRLLADLGYTDNSYAREQREAIECFDSFSIRAQKRRPEQRRGCQPLVAVDKSDPKPGAHGYSYHVG
jgi:hypothetical protein